MIFLKVLMQKVDINYCFMVKVAFRSILRQVLLDLLGGLIF